MKLVSFSVRNYRSITRARKLKLSDSTILIGPNNEGKSNILRALILSLTALERLRRPFFLGPRNRRREEEYNWERDYPVDLQGQEGSKPSSFTLEFSLSSQESRDFSTEFNSNLKDILPIELSFDEDGRPTFKVVKQGRGTPKLTGKRREIAEFITNRHSFIQIPAVRTADKATEIVERMVAAELAPLEKDREYRDALRKIADIQKPILLAVSDTIRESLQEFLPAVVDVRVEMTEDARYRAFRRSCRVTVDDGTATFLEHKGDGVQSLAAISLIRRSSLTGTSTKNVTIALEEPEAHLHPEGIHALRAVLSEISQNHQLVITTHCPLLADRLHVSNNIIVRNNKAEPAKSIADVRDALGVRASDNLRHAELVLLVEGTNDARAITALIRSSSESLHDALDNRRFAIVGIGGCGNLSAQVRTFTAALCSVHCLLDNDEHGRQARNSAVEDKILADSEVHLCSCPGQREAEFEDLLDPAVYDEILIKDYGVTPKRGAARRTKKWSARMEDAFESNGKTLDNRTLAKLKADVAAAIEKAPRKALHKQRRGAFDALLETLEHRLAQVRSPATKKKTS